MAVTGATSPPSEEWWTIDDENTAHDVVVVETRGWASKSTIIAVGEPKETSLQHTH